MGDGEALISNPIHNLTARERGAFDVTTRRGVVIIHPHPNREGYARDATTSRVGRRRCQTAPFSPQIRFRLRTVPRPPARSGLGVPADVARVSRRPSRSGNTFAERVAGARRPRAPRAPDNEER